MGRLPQPFVADQGLLMQSILFLIGAFNYGSNQISCNGIVVASYCGSS